VDSHFYLIWITFLEGSSTQ